MCQCVARSDCTVEVESFVYNMDPGACFPAFHGGTIRDTKALTHDVNSFSVELAQPADFDAGQFVTMQVPSVGGYRGYSMVNFERATSQLDFVIKKKPGGGCSEWLFKGGADGARVDLFGPLGTATFYPTLGKNILCIAGGSGVAGMMSILERARQERYFEQFNGYVFFGVRTYDDAFYLAELGKLASEFPDRLHVTIALSTRRLPLRHRWRTPLSGSIMDSCTKWRADTCRASTRTSALTWLDRLHLSMLRFACCCCKRSCPPTTSAMTNSVDADAKALRMPA